MYSQNKKKVWAPYFWAQIFDQVKRVCFCMSEVIIVVYISYILTYYSLHRVYQKMNLIKNVHYYNKNMLIV